MSGGAAGLVTGFEDDDVEADDVGADAAGAAPGVVGVEAGALEDEGDVEAGATGAALGAVADGVEVGVVEDEADEEDGSVFFVPEATSA
jgi:hypothetical protein